MTSKREIKGNKRKTRAFIGLGSNAGDRVGYVQQAMQFLKDIPRISVVECSSLYETEPLGVEYSHWFVNAVAAIDTTLSPEELLEVCLSIERRLTELHSAEATEAAKAQLGRIRIIDIDLLFFGDEVRDTETLRVPHPNIAHRAYALVPLLEIAPNFIHPLMNKTTTELHEALPAPELVFLYGTRGVDQDLEMS